MSQRRMIEASVAQRVSQGAGKPRCTAGRLRKLKTTAVSTSKVSALQTNERISVERTDRRSAASGSARTQEARQAEPFDRKALLSELEAHQDALRLSRSSGSTPAQPREPVAAGPAAEDEIGPRKSLFVRGKLEERSATKLLRQRGRTAERRRSSADPDRVPAFRASGNDRPSQQRRQAAAWQRGERRSTRGGPPAILSGSGRSRRDAASGSKLEAAGVPAERRRRSNLRETLQREGSGEEGLEAAVDFETEEPVELPAMDVPVPIRGQERRGTGTFYTSETFAEAGAAEEMVAALASSGFSRPSYIQAAALKAVAAGSEHLAIADHAGSGKTLAYLVPLLQRLRAQEASEGRRLAERGKPVLVVVLPTNELAAQVYRVVRAISSGGAYVRAITITGGHKRASQRRQLAEVADVVVGTPGRLAELIASGDLALDACAALVLDEADVLLGEGSMFEDQVRTIREAATPSVRFVLVTASLPEPTWMHLQGEFPGIKPILGPGLHRPAPGSLEQLIDCSGGDVINEETGYARKAVALLKIIQEQRASRTVVFCNKLITCRKVENTLSRSFRDRSVSVMAYHTAIEESRRKHNLETFLRPPVPGEAAMVLVCTDRASRGVDTPHVRHVVMFDFPRDPSEYVRRAGRTARGAGGAGVVSLLVLGRQVPLARQVLDRNDRGAPLHRVPAA